MTMEPRSFAAGTPRAAPADEFDPVVYGPGFHDLEYEEGHAFRWMAREAVLRLGPADGAPFLELDVWCERDDLSQRLRLVTEGDGRQEHELAEGPNVVSIAVGTDAAALRLEVSEPLRVDEHPGDARDLALRLAPPHRHGDAERHGRVLADHTARVRAARTLLDSPLGVYARSARAVRYEAGFHGVEVEDGLAFRWMSRRGVLRLPPHDSARFLELQVCCHLLDLSQRLTSKVDVSAGDHPLVGGWNVVSVPVPPGAETVVLEASRLLPPERHPDDPRPLAVQVRWPLLHAEAARHGHVTRQQDNRVLNLKEMLQGAVRLESTPWKLGIDIQGSCNVKPPCVYCAWDLAKAREGANVDVPFNLQTLSEYGPLFDNAAELVNCSIGEPFMMREMDLLLDAFGSRGKVLELTTNGQILTETNIRKLLGRNVHLYISMDAATPQTYARLRNDAFDRLTANVRRLVRAKGGPGRLPLVYLVFMPMRANVHEVDAFVELCAELEADRLVLRPVNASEGVDLVWDRAGYRFDYQKELLPFDELVRVSGRVAELCRRHGVPLSDQMDFGGAMEAGFTELFEEGRRRAASLAPVGPRPPARRPAMAGPPPATPVAPEPRPTVEEPVAAAEPADAQPTRLPLCTEPWSSLYVLRRGTLPCCYGGPSLAPMAGFQQAWNSPLMQELRSELRDGRFHRYCFDSPDCPLVRKAEESGRLSASQQMLLRTRRLLARGRRAGFGWPGRAWRRSKALVRSVLVHARRA
jgi:MoaA/NifB/PqqE/SkfB family radical SAM enzyme